MLRFGIYYFEVDITFSFLKKKKFPPDSSDQREAPKSALAKASHKFCNHKKNEMIVIIFFLIVMTIELAVLDTI